MSTTIENTINRPRNRNGFNLGLEIWEILTVLTVVLSIASGLMWFSNLKPRKEQDQFLWIEQNKSYLYSLFEEKKQPLAKVNFAINYKLKEKCYQDIQSQKIDKTEYQSKKEALEKTKNDIIKIKELFATQISDISGKNEMSDFINSVSDYLQLHQNNLENQLDFASQTLQIQKKASQICSSPIENVDQQISDFSKLAGNFSESHFSINENYRKNLYDWASTTKNLSIAIKNQPLEKAQESLGTFTKQMVNIFKTNYELENQNQEESAKIVQTNLEKLENWQQNFTKENKNLLAKIVYISRE